MWLQRRRSRGIWVTASEQSKSASDSELDHLLVRLSALPLINSAAGSIITIGLWAAILIRHVKIRAPDRIQPIQGNCRCRKLHNRLLSCYHRIRPFQASQVHPVLQGGPSGLWLYFVDFDWHVPPNSLHAILILQLPEVGRNQTYQIIVDKTKLLTWRVTP